MPPISTRVANAHWVQSLSDHVRGRMFGASASSMPISASGCSMPSSDTLSTLMAHAPVPSPNDRAVKSAWPTPNPAKCSSRIPVISLLSDFMSSFSFISRSLHASATSAAGLRVSRLSVNLLNSLTVSYEYQSLDALYQPIHSAILPPILVSGEYPSDSSHSTMKGNVLLSAITTPA